MVGVGMAAKIGFDEWRGERWSQFGGAMSAAWDSRSNFYSSVEATKNSVGTLAVDMTVGSLAYKVAGVCYPIGSRSVFSAKKETSISFGRNEIGPTFSHPSRPFLNATELSLMGERTSRALGEPASMSLKTVAARPAATPESGLMGDRYTTALSSASNTANASRTYSREVPDGRPLIRQVLSCTIHLQLNSKTFQV